MRFKDGDKWDTLFLETNLATMEHTGKPYGLLHNAALAVKDGKIAWMGLEENLTDVPALLADEVMPLDGRWITPGLIDCHTHLVYGGNRANEFEMRLQGKSYKEIQAAGGGIFSTVNATRQEKAEVLAESALARLGEMLKEGVMTVEIKSGYGLDIFSEIKILEVIAALKDDLPMRVIPTYLAAHVVPKEFKENPQAYVLEVCRLAIPEIARRKLATAVDVFCENIAFTTEQTETIFQTALEHGFKIKIHAEQLSNQGAAALAAQYGALSADHLEYLDEAGVKALAESGTVAVLLPGAFYFLREKKKPPVELLRQYKVPMAVATDSNPGTSPTNSLLLMLNMACTLFSLTPEEALAAVTREAAKALGLQDKIGTLTVGKSADLCVWDIDHPAELSYRFGCNPCHLVCVKGELI